MMSNWKTAKRNGFNSAMGIGTLCFFNSFLGSKEVVLLSGAFGATAVLLFAAQNSPLIQRKNMYWGHILSALIGVTCYKLFFPISANLAVTIAVGGAILVMTYFDVLHPPGGATAYIAVLGGASITDLGYLYVFIPVLTGILILDLINHFQTKI